MLCMYVCQYVYIYIHIIYHRFDLDFKGSKPSPGILSTRWWYRLQTGAKAKGHWIRNVRIIWSDLAQFFLPKIRPSSILQISRMVPFNRSYIDQIIYRSYIDSWMILQCSTIPCASARLNPRSPRVSWRFESLRRITATFGDPTSPHMIRYVYTLCIYIYIII